MLEPVEGLEPVLEPVESLEPVQSRTVSNRSKITSLTAQTSRLTALTALTLTSNIGTFCPTPSRLALVVGYRVTEAPEL